VSRSFKDLNVYKKAFNLAMEIFHVSKGFPREELYSLTNQIRRSSRSVCSNIAEGYRKRLYEAHFISKTSDADMENSETQVWLDFALTCGYVSQIIYDDLTNKSEEVGRMLCHMIEHPEKYRPKDS
jgi:four helix bundle protein